MAVTGAVNPVYEPGDNITRTVAAGQSVVGGKLVEVTNNAAGTVQHAAAGSIKVLGVARHSAAAGELVLISRVGVYNLTAAGAVTAGDVLFAGAAGTVATGSFADAGDAGKKVGIALAAIADTATGLVALGGML